jgi:predicted tellurium resistance membrane protein TerC
MARRRIPVVTLALGLAITLLTVLRPAFADPPPSTTTNATEPGQLPAVTVTLSAGGQPVKGKLKQAVVTVETDIGTTTINLDRIRRITFRKDPDGPGHDTVQLADKSILRGHILAKEFVVEITGGEARLKKSEVREIKVENSVPLSPMAILLGLLTLAAMEIVLGVDNIIFLAVVAAKLPVEQQPKARRIGILAALGTRIVLLLFLTVLLGLTAPLFTLPHLGILQDTEAREVSLRDLILLVGGLFLIGKSTYEIHEKLEHARAVREGEPLPAAAQTASFGWTIVTIAVIDIVFSLDSVITAIGMVDQVWVMIVAMVIAMLVMLLFAEPIARFVDRHPTVKVLALSFLILIGVMLVAEGLGQHMDKGYIYAAMSFSVIVEMINMQLRKPRHTPPPLTTSAVT